MAEDLCLSDKLRNEVRCYYAITSLQFLHHKITARRDEQQTNQLILDPKRLLTLHEYYHNNYVIVNLSEMNPLRLPSPTDTNPFDSTHELNTTGLDEQLKRLKQ